MIIKTNTLNYIFIAILLIIVEEKKVHTVTFYSHIFKATKLNYNKYNKEFLMIFKIFHI